MSKTTNAALLIGAFAVSLASCQRSEETVSFSEDVQPILEENCLECHQKGGSGYEASGFSVASYEALMEGTKYGPVVKPGDSFTSAMNMLIEGRADPSIQMPHGKDPLTEKEIEILRTWVDQGAKNN
jgi:hypothetical protein